MKKKKKVFKKPIKKSAPKKGFKNTMIIKRTGQLAKKTSGKKMG